MKDTDGSIVVSPRGRIDSGNASAFEKQLFEALEKSPSHRLILDFDGLEYISSAGLRVMLTASRRAGAPVTVRNVSPEVYGILEMTGFTSLLNAERKLRSMDVSGCEIIGRGGVSTVYRVDPDTVVKVYEIPGALDIIRNEQRLAKKALLRGIPTAISYDAVRVGDRYGSVFELVNARTFADLLAEDPGRIGELVRLHVGVIRQLHGAEAEPGELPDCREIYLKYLREIGEILPDGLRRGLEERFRAMPPDLHLVHGDIHMKNVMLSGDEPLLIDMDTLSTGNPVFDFADLYIAYRAFNEDDPSNSMKVLGLPGGLCRELWEKTLSCYLNTADASELQRAEDRMKAVGSVRFLYLTAVLRLGGEDLAPVRIRRAVGDLEKLLDRVRDFTI